MSFQGYIYIEAPKLFYWGVSDFSLFGGAEVFDQGRGGDSDKCNNKRSPRRTFTTQEKQDAARGDDDRYVYPTAPPQDPKDFLWLMTEEPHRTRRMAIMKAHPEVSVYILQV